MDPATRRERTESPLSPSRKGRCGRRPPGGGIRAAEPSGLQERGAAAESTRLDGGLTGRALMAARSRSPRGSWALRRARTEVESECDGTTRSSSIALPAIPDVERVAWEPWAIGKDLPGGGSGGPEPTRVTARGAHEKDRIGIGSKCNFSYAILFRQCHGCPWLLLQRGFSVMRSDR